MTSTTSSAAVIDVMRHDIERVSSSEDEKHDSKHAVADGVPNLYASGAPKSDPSLIVYDAAAEKRLVRKVDLYIVPTVAMLYLMCKWPLSPPSILFFPLTISLIDACTDSSRIFSDNDRLHRQGKRRQRSYCRSREGPWHESSFL